MARRVQPELPPETASAIDDVLRETLQPMREVTLSNDLLDELAVPAQKVSGYEGTSQAMRDEAERVSEQFLAAGKAQRRMGIQGKRRRPARYRSTESSPGSARKVNLDANYLRKRFEFVTQLPPEERIGVVQAIAEIDADAAQIVKTYVTQNQSGLPTLTDAARSVTKEPFNLKGLQSQHTGTFRPSKKDSAQSAIYPSTNKQEIGRVAPERSKPSRAVKISAIVRHRAELAEALRGVVEKSPQVRSAELARRQAAQAKHFQDALQDYGYQGIASGERVFLPQGHSLTAPNIGVREGVARRAGTGMQMAALPAGGLSQALRQREERY